MKYKILSWELYGIIFVFIVGALLHFVFEWSGESFFVGALASVNESVWEHFKQGFWPMAIYATFEYGLFGKYYNNFITAKAVAVYVIPVITGLIFYGYTAILGEEILVLDILIFAVAITLGQLISYRMITLAKLPRYINYLSIISVIILALVLVVFTFLPPHLPIFLDHNTGKYGIP